MIDTAYRSVEVEEVEPGWLVDLGDDGVLTVARVLKLVEGVELYGSTTRQPSRKRTVVFKRHEGVMVYADEETLETLDELVVDVICGTEHTGDITPTASALVAAVGEVSWTIPLRSAGHRSGPKPDGDNWHGTKPTAETDAED